MDYTEQKIFIKYQTVLVYLVEYLTLLIYSS